MYQIREICQIAGAPLRQAEVHLFLADGATPAPLLDRYGREISNVLRTDNSGLVEFYISTLQTVTFRQRQGTRLGPLLVLFEGSALPDPYPETSDFKQFPAAEPITMGQPVVPGLLIADANNLAHQGRMLGLAANSASINQMVTVVGSGTYMTNTGWNFTPNTPVYLGANGVLTHDPSGLRLFYPVGTAASATQLYINLGPAIRRT